MKTESNLQTRRRTISGYEQILKNREEREAQELAEKEELQRKSLAEMAVISQNQIKAICHEIQVRYTAMVNAGKDMQEYQRQLNEKIKEEELFHSTTEDLYKTQKIDESQESKMALRRSAYHILPILDSFFAFLALSPIITAKIAHSSSFLANFAEGIGVASSLLLGYGLSVLSRFAVSSMSEDDSPRKRTLKLLATGLAMISLPLMYIIGEVHFSGGDNWTYTICFSLVSLIIQLLIVSGYKQQNEALYYFRIKEKNRKTEETRKADEAAIRSEIDEIRRKIQNLVSSFEKDYADFMQRFTELAAARDEHILKFGQEAKIYLNQLVIYIGNLFCFRRQVIPLYLAEDGSVLSMPFVDFPNVGGINEIYTISDFVHIDNMLKRTWQEVNLTETNRVLEERQKNVITAQDQTDEVPPAGKSDSPKGEIW